MEAQVLSGTMLFRGLEEDEIEAACRALQAEQKRFEKGEVILPAGQTTERMGLVLSGSVTVESNDLWGNRTILSHVGPGQFFAETYAFLEDEPMPVDVVANEDCRILFVRIAVLRTLRPAEAAWMTRLTNNLLTISAHKNLTLSGRSFHTAPKSIRGRVMAYLNSVSLQKHSTSFDIPFDRQQLADYLNVERTALSKELGKMKAEGIIGVHMNHFTLRRGQDLL